MKISEDCQNKISESTQDPGQDGKPIPILYWIIEGIGRGDITGDETELHDFIVRHLFDLKDMEFIDLKNRTSMSGLLLENFIMGQDPDKDKAIISTLRLFFNKNPMALLKLSSIKTHTYPKPYTEYTKSAFTRIGASAQLQNALYPELSVFITNHAKTLNETQLLLIAHALHGNERLIQHLIDTLALPDPHVPSLARQDLSEDTLEAEIQSHWNPHHSNDHAYFYSDFPKIEMWRLFMDGAEQDFGWATYDGREPGCIDKLYQAWLFLQENHGTALTPEFFKKIHAICSKTIVRDPFFSGNLEVTH